jgi:hypothetical protein
MQESYSIDERLWDLVERAERYFSQVSKKGSGMRRWLLDLQKTREIEMVERWQLLQEFERVQRDGEGPRDDGLDVD